MGREVVQNCSFVLYTYSVFDDIMNATAIDILRQVTYVTGDVNKNLD